MDAIDTAVGGYLLLTLGTLTGLSLAESRLFVAAAFDDGTAAVWSCKLSSVFFSSPALFVAVCSLVAYYI